MANTRSRAITLLRAHFSIVATVKATAAGAVANEENRAALKWARKLLARFPLDVQFAANKLVLQDTEALRLSLAGMVKALTHKNANLGTDVAYLKKNAVDLAAYYAALRVDLQNIVAGAAAQSGKAAAKKGKREQEERRERGGRAGAADSKRAKRK